MYRGVLFEFAPDNKVIEAHSRLVSTYPQPRPGSTVRLEPLEMLVLAMLSQRTTHAFAEQAFANLYREFGDVRAIKRASRAEVERLIEMTTWPDMKAKRLQGALAGIEFRRHGALDLAHLYPMSLQEALRWLTVLPGVRYKTAACVLLMSTLHRRILPVDTGHRRLKIRMGLMSPKVGWDDAHGVLLRQLPRTWTVDAIGLHHDVVKWHSETTCTAVDPGCDRCPLLDLCTYGKRRVIGLPVEEVARPRRRSMSDVYQHRLCFD